MEGVAEAEELPTVPATVKEGTLEKVGDPTAEGVCVAITVTEREMEGEGEAVEEEVREGEAEGILDMEPLVDPARNDTDTAVEGERDCEDVMDPVPPPPPLIEGLLEGLEEAEGDFELEGEWELLWLGMEEVDTLGLFDSVSEVVGDKEKELELDTTGDVVPLFKDPEATKVVRLDTDGDPVTFADCVPTPAAPVGVCSPVPVAEMVGVVEMDGERAVGKRKEGVGEEQAVELPPPPREAEGQGEGEGDRDTETESEGEWVVDAD